MSGPRTKRQFAGASADPSQRQITSFFTKPISIDTIPAPSGRSPAPTSQHHLPANVQSNLISVGMRVRKSVPEGYKTGSQYGGFSLWTEDDAPFLEPRSPGAKRQHVLQTGASVAPLFSDRVGAAAAVAAAQRELAPFCGLHTIGGLSTQPVVSTPEVDDYPGLSSSQDSVQSNIDALGIPSTPVSRPINRRKRSFAEDDDHTLPEIFQPNRVYAPLGSNWPDEHISPMSMVPSGSSWGYTRVMAVPKGQLARLNGQHKALANAMFDGVEGVGKMPGLEGLGQENMVTDESGEVAFLGDDAMDIEDF